MSLGPAFQAFIDESNSPVFKLDREDTQRPYVVCCAIIPFDDQLVTRMAIPRSSITGEALKSSAKGMTDSIAAECIEKILGTESEIAIVGVDGGEPWNVKSADKLANAANVLRKDQRRPSISAVNAIYLRASWEALLRAVESFYSRKAVLPSPLEVVFDQANLKSAECDFVSGSLKDVCQKHGLSIRTVSWASEQVEPLLLVPDIFAGVFRRQATHGDVPLAWNKIQSAIQTGRAVYRDGIAVSKST